MSPLAYLRPYAVLAATLAVCFASPAFAGNRIALVIGNSNYENTQALSNPVNDADDLAAALRRVGFDVDLERNLTKQGMEAAITRFSRKAQGADAALFYYAGHGMQYRGGNYLMPVDARLEDEFNLNFELTRLDDVLFGLERASGVKILVLDSCRNNPLLDRLTRSTKSASRDLLATRGLAKIDAARGMLVAYSTQPNQVAVDGAGRNSPFTSALVKYIGEPGLEVGTLFRRVAIDVNRVTQGRQLPELSVSLLGEFYLNTHDTDVQAWAKVRYSSDPIKLKEFIATYPKSLLGTDAKQIVDRIERENRARAEREQAERERLERDRQAKHEAERKRIEQELKSKQAQEQLQKLEQERVEQSRLAREKAAHDELVRTEEERTRVAREEAERQKREKDSSVNTNVAMLPPANEPAPISGAQVSSPLPEMIPAELKCSAYSVQPERNPEFKIRIAFNYSTGVLKGTRIIGDRPGKENYEGTISRTGEIKIKGTGGYNDGSSNWVSNFHGQIRNDAVASGRLSVLKRQKGTRDCSITFNLPLAELLPRLGLLEADLPAEPKSSNINSGPAKPNDATTAKSTASGRKIFTSEPPRGVNALRLGEIAYIDDKSCPTGQIKEMTGGALRKGIDRRYRCVRRSSIDADRHLEKTATRSPAPSHPTGNAVNESMKIRGAGSIMTGQTVQLTTSNGRKMTCTGGSIKHNIPRTCFWN